MISATCFLCSFVLMGTLVALVIATLKRTVLPLVQSINSVCLSLLVVLSFVHGAQLLDLALIYALFSFASIYFLSGLCKS